MDASDSVRSLAKERLIDRYTQKWDDILFSTKPIDRAKAEAAIIKAYNLINRPAPDIYFLTSPSQEQCEIFSQVADRYVNDGILWFLSIKSNLIDKITTQIKTDFQGIYNYPIRWSESTNSIDVSRREENFSELCWIVYDEYLYRVATHYNTNIYKILEHEHIMTNVWYMDLYFDNVPGISNLKLKSWKALRSVCAECPYLVPFDSVCFVIDRPCEIHRNEKLLVHAKSKPAIKYADGFEIYCHDGEVISGRFFQDNNFD